MAVNSTDLSTALDELAWANQDAAPAAKTRGSSELGKEEFLQLLVCQLSNQDPLNPENDTEFVAQLAQFSALEQMTNLNTAFSNSSAYSLVGKQVVLNHEDSSGRLNEIKGVVDYVEIRGGEAYLSVNGSTYSMDDLVQVMDSFYAIKGFLPSAEQQELSYDQAEPSIVNVKINLGKEGYEANSVAVVLNGAYVDSDKMTYKDGVLSISPGAFENLPTGNYFLGLYFDDPYSTTVTDKVVVKVVNSANDTAGETEDTGSDDQTEDKEGAEI